MFTGMIQDVGRIVSVSRQTAGARVTISTHLDTSAWQAGDSVAVDGCCLTVTDMEGGTFSATLSPETLNVTCFDTAREGQRVNLEPALRVGDTLGGHMVTGHVDGIGEVAEICEMDSHRIVSFRLPGALHRYVVIKGSVAVNGVSLTVNGVDETGCTVNLIPHTLAHTNLGDLKIGDRVNIETDILGRYVERLMWFQQEKP